MSPENDSDHDSYVRQPVVQEVRPVGFSALDCQVVLLILVPTVILMERWWIKLCSCATLIYCFNTCFIRLYCPPGVETTPVPSRSTLNGARFRGDPRRTDRRRSALRLDRWSGSMEPVLFCTPKGGTIHIHFALSNVNQRVSCYPPHRVRLCCR